MRPRLGWLTPYVLTALVAVAAVGVGYALLQDECWDCPELVDCGANGGSPSYYLTLTNLRENGQPETRIATLDPPTGVLSILPTTHFAELNALAARHTDGLLLTMTQSNNLLALEGDGSLYAAMSVNWPTNLPAGGSYRAGAVSDNGHYWVVRSEADSSSSTGFRSTHLVVIDVPPLLPSAPTSVSVAVVIPISQSVDLQDIAFDPTFASNQGPIGQDHRLLGFDGQTNTLVYMSGSLVVSSVGPDGAATPLEAETAGGLAFFGPSGAKNPVLFGESTAAGPGQTQGWAFEGDLVDDGILPSGAAFVDDFGAVEQGLQVPDGFWVNTDAATCAPTSDWDEELLVCDELYMTTVAGNPFRTTLWDVTNSGTLLNPRSVLPTTGTLPSTSNFHINAISLHPNTALIYGFLVPDAQGNTSADPALYSVDSSGAASLIAPVQFTQHDATLQDGRYFAATFVPYQGQWSIAVLRTAIGGITTHVVVVDTQGNVVSSVPLVLGPQGTRWNIADIATHPATGELFGLNAARFDNSGALLQAADLVKIDLTTGDVEPQGMTFPMSDPSLDQAGAAFFSSVVPNGTPGPSLYLFGDTDPQQQNGQETMLNVTWLNNSQPVINTATAVYEGQNSFGVSGSDGASCPEGIQNLVPLPGPSGDPHAITTTTGASIESTAPFTPVQVATSEFCVAGVASDDTLNVRTGPGVEYEDVGDLAYDATGVRNTGLAAYDSNDRLWYEVLFGDGVGWVAASFLTPAPCEPASGTSSTVTTNASEANVDASWTETSTIYSIANNAGGESGMVPFGRQWHETLTASGEAGVFHGKIASELQIDVDVAQGSGTIRFSTGELSIQIAGGFSVGGIGQVDMDLIPGVLANALGGSDPTVLFVTAPDDAAITLSNGGSVELTILFVAGETVQGEVAPERSTLTWACFRMPSNGNQFCFGSGEIVEEEA